jgi:hypothetical protein
MAKTTSPLSQVPALDRQGETLAVGDHVRFIMQGFFLPREQESFGYIDSIDSSGGIKIKMVSIYKHFASNSRPVDKTLSIYFTHHHYDPARKARVYFIQLDGHDLFIEKLSREESVALDKKSDIAG